MTPCGYMAASTQVFTKTLLRRSLPLSALCQEDSDCKAPLQHVPLIGISGGLEIQKAVQFAAMIAANMLHEGMHMQTETVDS